MDGSERFGLEECANAFYTAWLYCHRADAVTLDEWAVREGLSEPFLAHIWSVL